MRVWGGDGMRVGDGVVKGRVVYCCGEERKEGGNLFIVVVRRRICVCCASMRLLVGIGLYFGSISYITSCSVSLLAIELWILRIIF